MKKLIVAILVVSFFLSGCAAWNKRSSRLRYVELGMSKSNVLRRMGSPSAVKGGIKNEHGQVIEVWEYNLYTGKSFSGSFPERYWLYFADGVLAKYNMAGDWRKEQKAILTEKFK